ncbi:ABC transporter ATP-binding protein [Streptomyces sp. NPDC056004]|uniref:ABC transporter ATP-binding protein n=1 Tax=Streptomyces sp. NPDC056004 TaxID=3345677 RepID=UPI0035DC15CD
MPTPPHGEPSAIPNDTEDTERAGGLPGNGPETAVHASPHGFTERLRAREEWKFFAVLPRAARTRALIWWCLIVARGLLPALFTLAVGLLVSSLADGHASAAPLAAVGTVFLLIQVLGALHGQLSTDLGERLSCWLHGQLIDAATTPSGLAHLESHEMAAELTTARDFDQGVTGPPMHLSVGFVAGSLVQAVTGFAQVALLAAYTWWAPLVIAGAWLSTHWLLRESSVWDRDAAEVRNAQRQAEYTYRLAVESPAAKELRLFGLSAWTVAQFTRHRRRLVDLRWQETRLRQKPVIWTLLVLLAANGLVLWSLARSASTGTVDAGHMTVYAQAVVGASAIAFGGLNWSLPPAAHSVASVLRLRTSMAKVGALPSGGGSARRDSAVELRFKGVKFSYGDSKRPVLDGLDLTVEAGTSLAIVGVNGAGKTTLVKLLCRLYDPTAGTIEADGTDLRDLAPESWRSRVTAVFQDFIRYEMPLRTNVAPAGAPDDAVLAALRDAGAVDVSDLDTVLAPGYDGGRDLSGGQWQRVAVARALCAVRQGAGVVILDEPTAQLDVKGEAEVFERILRATRGSTTILISHRFATVRHADQICVLEDGRVSELGTHEELMAARGRYRQMFDLQASRFETEEPDVTHA